MNEDHTIEDISIESLVSEIADDFLARLQRGEMPVIEEYAKRYPQIAEVLRRLLPTMQMIGKVISDGDSIAEATEPEAIGVRRLGDFRIIREVGRGGMGVVYEAKQISLGRRVALKVLPFASVLDDRQLQRFKNEAQAAAQLHHTNIVPVFSVGCERGVHYYAMQFVKGPTLANVIHELRQLSGLDTTQPGSGNGTISRLAEDLTSGRFAPAKQAAADGSSGEQAMPDEMTTSTLGTLAKEHSTKSPEFFRSVANLGVQAAKALEYAHSNGIIHRDIKPSNLLLDVKGTLWVTDFGLAHFRSDTGMKLTMSGDLLGTIRYMSSEQALGKHALLDHRTDIYSLGVTMYELLTLEPAFTGCDRQELLQKIADEEPRALRRLNEATPTDLETIVLKAMTKEPEARYTTAQELSDDLQRFLEDKPIKAKRPTLAQRAAKWSRRHKTVVWSGVVLLLMASVGLAISTFLIARKQAEVVQQRDLAEGNLRLAMEALDEIYLKVAEKQLSQAEYIDQADRQLLQKALMFYEQFAQENLATAEAKQETAKACLRVGKIRDMLGEHAEAEQAYLRAITLFEELVGEYPTAPENRSDLVKALRDLSDVLSETGQIPQAETHLRQAVDIGEKLVADVPDVPEYRHELSSTYRTMGLWLKKMGSWEQAEKNLRQSVELTEKLAAEDPNEHSYRGLLAENRHQLGHILEDTGRNPEAEQLYRQALASLEKLTAELAAEVRYQNELSETYQSLGSILRDTGRLAEAEQLYLQALEHIEKLVAKFPAVPEYRTNLAENYNLLGLVLRATDRSEEAEDFCRRSMKIREKLTTDFPTVTSYQDGLASNYFNLAYLLNATARSDKAIEAYQQSLEILEKLASENPTVTRNQSNLALNYREMAGIYDLMGRANEAEETCRRALEITKKLAADFPTVTSYQSNLASHYNYLAVILSGAMRRDEQEDLYRHALEIWQELVSQCPTVISHRDELSATFNNLGNLLMRTKRFDEAQDAYQQSLEIREKLVSENPTLIRYQLNLSITANGLALFYENIDRLDEAETTYQRAMAIGEKLLAENPSKSDYQFILGVTFENMATNLQKQGKGEEACQHLEEAISHLQTAASSNPRNFAHRCGLWDAYSCLASFQMKLREIDESEKVSRQAIELAQGLVEDFPEMPAARLRLVSSHRSLGLLFEETGRPEEAGKCYLQSLSLLKKLAADFPDVPGYWRTWLASCCRDLNGLAWYFVTCTDPNDRDPLLAVGLAEKAIEGAPEEASFWGTLGVAYYRTGQWEDAVGALHKSMKLRSGGVSCDFFVLAMANWQLGHQDEARRWYDKAADRMSPQNEELRRLQVEAAELLGPVTRKPWATVPQPADGAPFDVTPNTDLRWTPGLGAIAHSVYFGTDPENLRLLGKTEDATHLKSPTLEKRRWYCWRVDSVKADGSVITGKLWSFSTGNMIGWWKFNQNERGTVTDSSGKGLNGKLVGDATVISDAERGSVLSLDGDGDYVDCGTDWSFDITESITVAAWIKVNKFDKRFDTIASKGDSAWRLQRNSRASSLCLHCTGIKSSGRWARVYTNSEGVEGTVDVEDSKWHHVAALYDGRKIYLYVDDTLDNCEEASGSIGTNNEPVCIGTNSEFPGREWNGLIDDVRIYSYVLNEAEVAALFAGQGPGPLEKPKWLMDKVGREENSSSGHSEAGPPLGDSDVLTPKGKEVIPEQNE